MTTEPLASAAVPPDDPILEAQMAFAAALAAVENVAKTQTADTGKYTYRYADLGDVLDECKRACQMHGLSLFQAPTVIDGMLAVHLELLHQGGGRLALPPLMMKLPSEAQPYGSALTYARRYQLLTVFGIAPEDDDGHAATVAGQVQPGRRTEAERMIRESIAAMDEETRKIFVEDFKGDFGMSLQDLPAARHGDALKWSREWDEARQIAAGLEAEKAKEPAQ